jgi:hypothetical protein
MSEGTALEGTEARPARQCRHHWVIDAPEGATSLGVCKLCGAKKEFPNSASDSLWEGGGGSSGGSRPDGDIVGKGSSHSYTKWIDTSSPGDDF